MWGAGSGSGNSSQSGLDSATMHETLGQSAALVNSAKRGFLYSQGTSIVLESVGAQSIVNTSIYGDNNIANVSANQTATNTGNVNANGSISLSGNASTTVGNGTASNGTASNGTSGNGTSNNNAATLKGSTANGASNTKVLTGTTNLSSTTVGSGSTVPANGTSNGATGDSSSGGGG